MVKSSSEADMMTMPAMMLADVTLLLGSYLSAVGMSSLTLMNVCTAYTPVLSHQLKPCLAKAWQGPGLAMIAPERAALDTPR